MAAVTAEASVQAVRAPPPPLLQLQRGARATLPRLPSARLQPPYAQGRLGSQWRARE